MITELVDCCQGVVAVSEYSFRVKTEVSEHSKCRLAQVFTPLLETRVGDCGADIAISVSSALSAVLILTGYAGRNHEFG